MSSPADRMSSPTVRPTTLRCSSCRKWLPDDAFYRDRTAAHRRGRSHVCRECDRLRKRQPRECEICGRPTPSREARFCDLCRPAHQRELGRGIYFDRFGSNLGYDPDQDLGYWTRERIIAAIQKWARTHNGRPPSRGDWQKTGPGGKLRPGEQARRKWPSISSIIRMFGSWNTAIEAAGHTPRTTRDPNTTTCWSGRHPWTPENIYTSPGGKRKCRVCHRERARERYQRKKEAAAEGAA